jgi:uncharacterized protein
VSDIAPQWLVRTFGDPAEVAASSWNALLAACPQPTPFMRHEWIVALHDSACASPATGWTLLILTVSPVDQPDDLVGACVAYVKTHSYGEYVFDWAWANAYQQAGLNYYPKLLCASPFTPVPGSRLLALHADARAALLQGMRSLAMQLKASSAHLLLGDADDLAAAQSAGWLIRHGVQFHWQNRHVQTPGAAPYADMADYLGALHRDKRKKILQERRRVREAGVSVRALHGTDITETDWAFFYACYQQTYLAHGNAPYLSPAFFQQVAKSLAPHWLMFMAERDGEPVAASLLGVDRQLQVAWGRYWGAQAHVPCLHFELCYYAPLAWCIEHGFQRFEGGAQGEHKMARGLMPTPTWSAHWLQDDRFAHAVADFLAREGQHMDAYVDELRDRQVFAKPFL